MMSGRRDTGRDINLIAEARRRGRDWATAGFFHFLRDSQIEVGAVGFLSSSSASARRFVVIEALGMRCPAHRLNAAARELETR